MNTESKTTEANISDFDYIVSKLEKATPEQLKAFYEVAKIIAKIGK